MGLVGKVNTGLQDRDNSHSCSFWQILPILLHGMYLFTVLTCRSSEGIVTMAILESIQNSYVLYQTSTKLAAPSLNICPSLEICIELTTRYYDHSKLQNLKGVGWGGVGTGYNKCSNSAYVSKASLFKLWHICIPLYMIPLILFSSYKTI